jgi:hypothetical protein
MVAHLLTASRRLDLHHLRTRFRQQQRRQGSGEQGREIENEYTFERPHCAFPVWTSRQISTVLNSLSPGWSEATSGSRAELGALCAAQREPFIPD